MLSPSKREVELMCVPSFLPQTHTATVLSKARLHLSVTALQVHLVDRLSWNLVKYVLIWNYTSKVAYYFVIVPLSFLVSHMHFTPLFLTITNDRLTLSLCSLLSTNTIYLYTDCCQRLMLSIAVPVLSRDETLLHQTILSLPLHSRPRMNVCPCPNCLFTHHNDSKSLTRFL